MLVLDRCATTAHRTFVEGSTMRTRTIYHDTVQVSRLDHSAAFIKVESEMQERTAHAVKLLCTLNEGMPLVHLDDLVNAFNRGGRVTASFDDKAREEVAAAG
jgi:hypothetical protein